MSADLGADFDDIPLEAWSVPVRAPVCRDGARQRPALPESDSQTFPALRHIPVVGLVQIGLRQEVVHQPD